MEIGSQCPSLQCEETLQLTEVQKLPVVDCPLLGECFMMSGHFISNLDRDAEHPCSMVEAFKDEYPGD